MALLPMKSEEKKLTKKSPEAPVPTPIKSYPINEKRAGLKDYCSFIAQERNTEKL